MPTRVITATDSNSSGVEIKQKEIQDTAQPRRITSIVLVNKGTGYNSAPSVSVVGVDARGNSLDSVQLGLSLFPELTFFLYACVFISSLFVLP